MEGHQGPPPPNDREEGQPDNGGAAAETQPPRSEGMDVEGRTDTNNMDSNDDTNDINDIDNSNGVGMARDAPAENEETEGREPLSQPPSSTPADKYVSTRRMIT